MLRRRIPFNLELSMLLGAWRMYDRDDFAVLWGLTTAVIEEFGDKRSREDAQAAGRQAET